MIITLVILYLIAGCITLGFFVQQDSQLPEKEQAAKNEPLAILFMCVLLWWALWLVVVGYNVSRKMEKGK